MNKQSGTYMGRWQFERIVVDDQIDQCGHVTETQGQFAQPVRRTIEVDQFQLGYF
jgi:hypothetical protein